MTLTDRRKQVSKDTKHKGVIHEKGDGQDEKRFGPAVQSSAKSKADGTGFPELDIYHSELYDSRGTLVAWGNHDKSGLSSLRGFIPRDGEEYTFKSAAYYNNDNNGGSEEEEEDGPQTVTARLNVYCSGATTNSEPIKLSRVPSHIHSPAWVHLGNTPPPEQIPGVPVSFKYKYDAKLCAEGYAMKASHDSPTTFDMTIQGIKPDGTFAEWGGLVAGTAFGFGQAGIVTNQTYGANCESSSASSAHCQGHKGSGVNTATGAYGQNANDGILSGESPVSLTRSYSSNNDAVGILGQGWSTPWDSSLTVKESGDVTFRSEDGSEYPFAKKEDGTFSGPVTSHSTLTKGESGYSLKSRTGKVLEFSPGGDLLKITDRQGRSTSFTHDAGNIETITSANGRRANFTYSADRLARVSLSDGRDISYEYEGVKLVRAVGVGGASVRYTYDSNNRLKEILDQRGNIALRNQYDGAGRVTEQTDASSQKTTFSYKGEETDITAPDGGVWTDIYVQNVLQKQYDPFGNTTSFSYTFALDPVATIDALGNTFTTGIDKRGRINSFETPLSKKSWTYRSTGSLSSHTNGNGKQSKYTYDPSQHIISATDALGNVTSYTYDQSGRMETVKSAIGKETRYAYDELGNLKSTIHADGAQVTQEFDAAGRVISVTDPRGNASGADPAKFTTRYTYNAEGFVKTSTDAKSDVTEREYDAAGNLVTLKRPDGETTGYSYDAANRLTETKDAGGNLTTLTYDSMGNVSSSTDVTGAKTTYTYDKAQRVATMTSPRGNVAGADPTKYTWKYGYDKVNNQTTATDPAGNTTRTGYDAEYRPTAVTDPLGHTRSTKYDGEGNILESTDALKQKHTYIYDANGQLKSVTDRDSRTVSYDYDNVGNLISELSPGGNKISYAYDDNGRLSTTVDPRGNATGADPSQYTWRTLYDLAGNVTGQQDPLGNKTTNTYDAVNNLATRTDGEGNKTEYAYDKLRQLTAVTPPDGGTTTIDYDLLGNMKARTDANQHVTKYEYDKAGRLTKVADPLERATSYEYDPDGNRRTITNARGQTQSTAFDARNLPTKTTYSDGTPTVTYTYDATGQPKTITDGTGTRTLTYDDEGRPLTITSPGTAQPFKYTYTNNGQVKTRTYPDAYAVSYTYDADGRIGGQTTSGKTTTYGWDQAGNLTSTKLPTTAALTETRTYDRAGRLASASEGTGARQFTRDADGRVISDTFKSATTTGPSSRYGYDAAGRMKRACTDTIATTSCLEGSGGATYGYDKVGNLTSTAASGTTTANTYDAADQLTKRVAGTTTTGFAYDADGNLTKDESGTYAYDAESRVKSATVGTDNFTFVYDADGNRTTSTKNGNLVRASRWDVNNPLAQIATDTNSTGGLIADYNYNPLGIAQGMNRTTGASYFLHDRQESVRAVHDAAGKESYTYSYTPWGEFTGKESVPGGQSSIFGYTGQYKDQYLPGRLALRARSYDPGTSRFTTTDPVPADTRNANSSPYAYANNDPANQSDPSGRCPLCISSGVGAAFGAVVEGGIYSWQHRDGGFSWGGLAKAGGKGAATGAVAGALMPGAGNAVSRSLGLTGGRAVATSTAVNAGVGAGYAWGVNQVFCRPTDPWDLTLGAAGGGAGSLVGPAFRWMKGRSLFHPPTTVSAHVERLNGYAFRGLRPNEDPTHGVRAPGTNPNVPAWQHVVQDNDSPWISLTRDPSIAYYKYGGQNNGVIAVDLSRMDSGAIDAAAYLHVPHEMYEFAKDSAFRDKEVLVKFSVDAQAIVKHWPAGTSFDQILRDIAAFD